jgi:hypothetical protein
MNLLCHHSLLIEAVVGGVLAIRLGPILWVVGDIGCRLTLVGHSIRREDGARLATL